MKPLIERILDAADNRKRSLFSIVQRNQLLGSDGQWYGGGGFPLGVKWTGESQPYWVCQNRDGTTYGKRYASEAEAKSEIAKSMAAAREEFRKELAQMTQARLHDQADYWLEGAHA